MIAISVVTFALLMLAAYLIAAPAMRPEPGGEEAAEEALRSTKDRILSDIKDLDLDLATGKLDEADHARLRAAALTEAAEAMRSLDELEREETPPDDGSDAVDPGADEDLEARIAARKQELAVARCPACSTAVDRDDVFCRKCGGRVVAMVTEG